MDRMPFVRRQLYVWICPPPDKDFHPCLGSPLLLKWAMQLEQLSFHRWDYELPGVADFMAAASRVNTISVWCVNVLEAARADSLLALTKSVIKLTAAGPTLASHYPATVTELRVDVGHCGGSYNDEVETGEVWDSMQVDNLLFLISQLPQLRKLSLALAALSTKHIQLSCPVPLVRCLQHLTIKFWVSDKTVIDLGWVQRQACPHLDLHIWVQTYDFEVHSAVVQQLSQLTVSALNLHLKTIFPAALQDIWASLTVKLVFPVQVCSSAGLAERPGLMCVAILAATIWHHLSWQALAACAAKVTRTRPQDNGPVCDWGSQPCLSLPAGPLAASHQQCRQRAGLASITAYK